MQHNRRIRLPLLHFQGLGETPGKMDITVVFIKVFQHEFRNLEEPILPVHRDNRRPPSLVQISHFRLLLVDKNDEAELVGEVRAGERDAFSFGQPRLEEDVDLKHKLFRVRFDVVLEIVNCRLVRSLILIDTTVLVDKRVVESGEAFWVLVLLDKNNVVVVDTHGSREKLDEVSIAKL